MVTPISDENLSDTQAMQIMQSLSAFGITPILDSLKEFVDSYESIYC